MGAIILFNTYTRMAYPLVHSIFIVHVGWWYFLIAPFFFCAKNRMHVLSVNYYNQIQFVPYFSPSIKSMMAQTETFYSMYEQVHPVASIVLLKINDI